MSSSGWCTIESDPAVFTEMLENFGVKGVAVEELISLDVDSIAALGKVYGIILLFKYKPLPPNGNVESDSHSVFFAKQVISNACATQAILNTVLNFPKDITIGDELKNFSEFVADMDPQTRGEMLGQSDTIRQVHNSFARPSAFEFQDRLAREEDDVYHFSAFIFKNGAIYELDGLQPGPIRLSPATADDFRQQLVDGVQAKIQQVAAVDTAGQGQGISFALMAVTEDRVQALEEQIALLMSQEQPVGELQAQLADLQEQRAAGKQENIRRRHNYIPAIIALLKALQEKGKLKGIMEASQKASEAKKEAAGKK